jgi:hypothetical protein
VTNKLENFNHSNCVICLLHAHVICQLALNQRTFQINLNCSILVHISKVSWKRKPFCVIHFRSLVIILSSCPCFEFRIINFRISRGGGVLWIVPIIRPDVTTSWSYRRFNYLQLCYLVYKKYFRVAAQSAIGDWNFIAFISKPKLDSDLAVVGWST